VPIRGDMKSIFSQEKAFDNKLGRDFDVDKFQNPSNDPTSEKQLRLYEEEP